MNVADIVQAILAAEGSGYSDRGADRGGPTKFGITQETLGAARGCTVSAADVEALQAPEAIQIYMSRYVTAPGFSRINDPELEALTVDAGVQHGVTEASKMLQRAAGIAADGVLGRESLTAVNSGDPKMLFARVCAARVRLYGQLVSHDPILAKARTAGFHLQAENAFGWANRIAGFIEEAL